jgi:hypothetical protein
MPIQITLRSAHVPEVGFAIMLPAPHPSVVFRPVADGAVLLHTQDEVYFGLNPVARQVWELLTPECASLDDVCARLEATYPEVAPDTLRADVSELLAQPGDRKLVVSAS